jgi:hypothetical protein
MAPKRRASSINMVAAKCARLSEDWQALAAKKEEAELDLDIALIVHELQRHPGKVRGCKLAVMGSAFLNDQDSKDARFPDTYIYLPKVAKSFLETWYETIDPRFTPMVRKELLKLDKCIMHKILYRAFLCEKSSSIPSHDKAKFKQIMEARHAEFGENLKKLTWDAEMQVCWQKCGVYALMPPAPAGHQGDHTYTSICFNNTISVQFEEAMMVTQAWTIEGNWSMRQAVLMSPKKDSNTTCRIKLPCKDMFDKHENFQDIWSGIKLSQLEDAGQPAEGAELPEAKVASSAEARLKDVIKTPPKGTRKTLSASQRKALADLRTLA